jgi:hypothetical protein
MTSVGITGDRFLINGRIQHLRGFTDFAGFDYFRRYGSVSPLALHMQELHHDFVSLTVPALSPRILLMKHKDSLFDLDPRQMPDFYPKLAQHAETMLATRTTFQTGQIAASLLPIYVLLADCAALGMSLAYQQDHVGQACEVLRHYPVLVELVNEYNNGPQQVDPLAFSKPPGVLISRGSPAEGGQIPWPGWDWSASRERRDSKWLQTIGDSKYSYVNGDWGGPPNSQVTHPVLDTEPRGAGEPGMEPKRYVSTADGHALGVLSAEWWHAGVYHSEAGLTSSRLPWFQLNSAITFFRGMMGIPEIP